MKRTGAVILSLVLLSCVTSPADQNSLLAEKPELLAKAEQDPLLKAELLKKHEMYAEAEEILTSMINAARPVDKSVANENYLVEITGAKPIALSYLYFSRADCLFRLEQLGQALADYTESYRLKNDPDLLYFIARCMYEERMPDEAIKKFNEYLATANTDRRDEYLALYFRASCVLGQGKLDAGLVDFQELQKKFPEWHDSAQNVINQVLDEKKKRESTHKAEKEVSPANQ